MENLPFPEIPIPTTPEPEPDIPPDTIKSQSLFLMDQVEQLIARADTKASLLAATEAILLSMSASSATKVLATVFSPKTQFYVRIASASALAAGVFLIMSFVVLLLVIFPQLKPPKQSSLMYFGSIANQDVETFQTAFLAMTPERLLRAILSEVHAKSGIARSKFRRISISINLLGISVVFWVIYLALTALTTTQVLKG